MKTSLELAPVLTPEQCADGVRRHCVTEHTHKVMQGFYLLQACSLYALPAGERGQGRKSIATVAKDSPDVTPPAGFVQWLQENLTGIVSQRTAYNYMQAATRSGLLLTMSETEAQAAAEAALAKVAKLSALYKEEEKAPATEEQRTPPGTPEEHAEQLLLPLLNDLGMYFVEGSDEERALYLAPLSTLEDMERKLRTGLDAVLSVKSERLNKPVSQVRSGGGEKHQAPGSKRQRSSKRQASKGGRGV